MDDPMKQHKVATLTNRQYTFKVIYKSYSQFESRAVEEVVFYANFTCYL